MRDGCARGKQTSENRNKGLLLNPVLKPRKLKDRSSQPGQRLARTVILVCCATAQKNREEWMFQTML